MTEKPTTIAIIILGVSVLILFGLVYDLKTEQSTLCGTIDTMEYDIARHYSIDKSPFIGTVLPIPKEIYYQDWVYVQDVDDRVYDKDDVLLVYEDHSEETVLIQFHNILDDGHLYYSYEANVSNGWWQPNYNTRHSITFEQMLVDDFNETTSDNQEWRAYNDR